ncbi:nod factor hydrolase protein 1-like isoform X1 [Typha latifolia]|uniref:nod factor hydrolase protein 1-like isoform X1 n=1 Tax=Typha latifolia TaxID=4733 RepID=UPI003C2FDD27
MGQISFTLAFISLIILPLASLSTSQRHCTSPDQVRAGYWFSSSNHYSPISSINTSLYTHLYYYYITIDPAVSTVALPPPDQVPLFATFSATLKSSNPSLKTLLSIATDEHQSSASNAAFSTMAADPNLRATFITSTIELARANAFDGLDLAWQLPASSIDMANFGILLEEWRARIEEEAQNASPPLLLTATAYFSNHLFEGPTDNLDYPTDAISKNLDWLNTLSFGFHKNSNITTADAPLSEKASHFSASYGIISWLDAGIPPCKLVMGVPLYGRSWFLKNKVKNGIGAPVVASGPKQKMSNQTGMMAYSEIEELLTDTSVVVTYDNSTVSAYFSSSNLWVSFNSLAVVEEKIEFALYNRLLGYFLWPISFDNSNCTVSKQASDVWLKYYDSPYFKDGYLFRQAAAPFELPPLDDSTTASAAGSRAKQASLKGLNRHLHLCLLLFLFFYQTIV